MTRRIVAFTDESTGTTWKTPEFNGDKNEFLLFAGEKSTDSCTANWDEIFIEFEGVTNEREFSEANIRAQKYYKSFMGEDILPIEKYICAGTGIIERSKGKCIELHYN